MFVMPTPSPAFQNFRSKSMENFTLFLDPSLGLSIVISPLWQGEGKIYNLWSSKILLHQPSLKLNWYWTSSQFWNIPSPTMSVDRFGALRRTDHSGSNVQSTEPQVEPHNSHGSGNLLSLRLSSAQCSVLKYCAVNRKHTVQVLDRILRNEKRLKAWWETKQGQEPLSISPPRSIRK